MEKAENNFIEAYEKWDLNVTINWKKVDLNIDDLDINAITFDENNPDESIYSVNVNK